MLSRRDVLKGAVGHRAGSPQRVAHRRIERERVGRYGRLKALRRYDGSGRPCREQRRRRDQQKKD